MILGLLLLPISLVGKSVTLEIEDLEAQRDKNNNVIYVGYPGESFSVTATVTDGDRNGEEISVAGSENVRLSGTSQSTQVSMVNNKVSTQINVHYTFVAIKPGTFTLGPATLSKSKAKSPESFQITIKEGNRTTPRAAQQSHAHSKNTQPTSRTQEEIDVFCKLSTQRTNLVVGEPIVCTLAIYARGPLQLQSIDPATLQEFSPKEIQQLRQSKEEINGKIYTKVEKDYVIAPLNAGKITINPVQVMYTYQQASKQKKRNSPFDAFFSDFFDRAQTRQALVSSNPLTLTISPLPATTHQVNGIGLFTTYQLQADKTNITAHEPFMLTLELSGLGDLEHIGDPALQLPAGAKFYKSKSEVTQDFRQHFSPGKKRFEFITQLAHSGEVVIPAQSFTFFDTTERAYKTLMSNELKLTVAPSATSSPTVTSTQSFVNQLTLPPAEKPSNSTIHYIYEDGYATKREGTSLPPWLFIIAFLMPLLVFWQAPAHAWRTSSHYLFRSQRHKRALNKQDTALNTLIKQERADQLYHFFTHFFATKFHQSLPQVTESFIEEKLLDAGWQQEKINEFIDYLNECAQLSFSSGSKLNHAKLLQRARYWLTLINS